MFLTETAQRADVVLPAASTYEKDGTLTNTAGEVQMTHRSDRSARPAQRFRFAPHSFAPARDARPWLAHSACARPKLRSTKSASMWRATICRDASLLGGRRGAFDRNLQRRSSRRTTCPRALFSLRTIICLQAAPWAATVPSSIRPTRQKTRRGVHHPAPSPGGIASQDRRPAVCCDDGAGVPHLVRAQSRRAHSVALGPLLRGRARIAAAARRRPEISIQRRPDAAGVRISFVYVLAPFLALSLALTAIALIPFGPPSVQLLGPADLHHRELEYRAAVPLRDHFDRRLWRRARRMVVQQQISRCWAACAVRRR